MYSGVGGKIRRYTGGEQEGARRVSVACFIVPNPKHKKKNAVTQHWLYLTSRFSEAGGGGVGGVP
jgi:hypothetical protein